MEKEQDNLADNNTIQRIGYNLALSAHIVFISTATIGAAILLAVLLFS